MSDIKPKTRGEARRIIRMYLSDSELAELFPKMVWLIRDDCTERMSQAVDYASPARALYAQTSGVSFSDAMAALPHDWSTSVEEWRLRNV